MTGTIASSTCMPFKTRWGDDAEDEDSIEESYDAVISQRTRDQSIQPVITGFASSSSLPIPPTHHSDIDSKGIKYVTSYRPKSSEKSSLIKTVTKIRVKSFMVREHVDMEKRSKWKKFGNAAIDVDQSNVTISSHDDVYMEDLKEDSGKKDDDPSKVLAGNLNAFWAKQQRRQLERKYDVDGMGIDEMTRNVTDTEGWDESQDNHTRDIIDKYVPPSARGISSGTTLKGAGSLSAMANRINEKGSSGLDNRDHNHNTIRVTNISEETTEADLQDLFRKYGRISRVYLAKDKETHQSRGFAFVSFVHREDASRAMEKLQGYGYRHLILKLEWARPSVPKDPGKEGTQFRSGYGQKLAQDTKERVSFASNLTR